MTNFSKLVITDKGKKLLNDALVLGKKVNFTNASVSEMRCQEKELQELCELQEIKQTVPIYNIVRNEDFIEMMIEFDNDTSDVGYYLRMLGVYAMLDGEEEILFALAKEQTEDLFISSGEVAVSSVNMKLKIQLENKDIVQLVVDRAGAATPGNVLTVRDDLAAHIQDKNNPHYVTKSQIGLGKVDNTADAEKPVSTAQQAALDSYYQQSAGYTDQKIAQLINDAPETLDTLKEVADAIEENKNVVDALDAAIGVKANQEDLDRHINDDIIHITATEREEWNNPTYMEADTLSVLNSGDKISTVFGKIAKAVSTLTSHIGTVATTGVMGHVKLTNGTSVIEDGYALDARQANASIVGTLANQIDMLNTNLSNVSPKEGSFAACSQISNVPVYGGTAYLGTSFYLPKGYSINVTNVTAIGAYGNFVASLDFNRYGNYIRPSTVNANLAGYMIQIEGIISKIN